MTQDKYQEAIEANIAVHSAMAEEYNTAEPHFRKESIERVEGIVEEIASRITVDKVLDLGCGTGFMINILRSRVKEIMGVDVTQAMLDKVDTSGKASISLINADTGKVELASNYYDLATAYTFLDHLYDMTPTFRNCYNSLKKGGLFYADLSPNAFFWDEIKKLQHTGDQYDEIVQREIRAVTSKDEEIEAEFGVDKETFKIAEHQKHIKGGLREESVKKDLESVGFKNIQFIYHWYVGQAQLVNDTTMERNIRMAHAQTMYDYLTKSLPLSRHLFKYVGFIAEK